MNDDQLIGALTSDLKPVRPLTGVAVRTASWCALAASSVVLGVYLFGVRADLASQLFNSDYVRENLLLLALAALTARSAFDATIPGANAGGEWRALPWIALLLWFASIATRAALETTGAPSETGVACVFRMLCLAALPLLALQRSLRRGVLFDPSRVGAHAALAASAFAMLGTQLICGKDDALHVLLWHFLPVVLAAMVGAALGALASGKRFTA